ncbi:formate-dependent phosphoribosylglycinamide formyltransferase [Pyruvatibacter mobilis]|uniref:formate-dependent phosphoribosylglycinamide formyltransferase n=1 Tax=Pyruvatibacter mobilis TaxID=1712261 RepID=UPI003BA94956
MRIGTPLTPSATRIMLLGSGELGKEVVIELQRFGAEVIAVDRYADAPAMQVAHRSHVIDMTDGDAIRRLVVAEQPHMIVPEIEAIATQELVAIEREGLAEVIPTAEAAQLTMNREGIRRLAAEELGLPTSPYAFATSERELARAAEAIGFPVFVKPVMSSSGKGQSFVQKAEDVADAWAYALQSGRVEEARVIVEGRVEFDYEITLLTVRSVDERGDIATSFCAPIGHRQEHGDYVESWQPQPMSEKALARAQQIAFKVTSRLGGRGIFGVEMFVKGDDVWFSEVSPRPHDTGLVTLGSQRQSEFALHARAILGLPVTTALTQPAASAVIYGGMAARGIAFDGLDAALRVPDAQVRLFGKPEAFVRRRMGVAVVPAKDIETARERAKEAASAITPVKV